MGHIRLGRLPKTRKWRSVFEVLETGEADPHVLAPAVAGSAATDLATLRQTPGVIGDGLWILSMLGAGTGPDYLRSSLGALGMEEAALRSPAVFVSSLPTRIDLGHRAAGAVFDEMADLSLRAALWRHLSIRTMSLFGSSADEVASACGELGRPEVFARVARDYLADFMSRVLRYAVDREASNFLGSSADWSSSADLLQVGERLDTYCHESSRIVEDFAEGWFSKSRYHSDEGVTRDATRRFAAHALTKLQMELQGVKDE